VDVFIDNKTPLLIDFVNLKIKLTQFFRGAHRDRVYIRVFIGVSDRICMIICVCLFLKKKYHKSEMHVRMSIYSGLEIQ
jgi:hypothetical protein